MRPDDLHDLFADFEPIDVRRMFGGLGVYRDDRIFALVAFDELFMKVDAETIPAFEAAGSSPFVYEGSGKPVTMPYWRLPPEAFDDPEALARYTNLALAVAARAAPPKKRRASRATAKET